MDIYRIRQCDYKKLINRPYAKEHNIIMKSKTWMIPWNTFYLTTNEIY